MEKEEEWRCEIGEGGGDIVAWRESAEGVACLERRIRRGGFIKGGSSLQAQDLGVLKSPYLLLRT